MAGKGIGKRRNQYIPDYVVFDLETTGTSSVSDDVIEISAVKVQNKKVVDEFTSLVNPGRHIPYGATNVNGITDDMVKDAPFFRDVLSGFLKFAGDMVLVGHNIHTFDMKFLYRDTEKYYGRQLENDYIDTLCLARNYLPELGRHRLTDLADHYGISSRGAHRALQDCRMNQQVFECLAKEMNPENVRLSGGRVCRRCGSIMKKRNGKFGEFWGCTSYPACRYTENA